MWWIIVGIVLFFVLWIFWEFVNTLPYVPEGSRLPTLGKELIPMSTKEKKKKKKAKSSSGVKNDKPKTQLPMTREEYKAKNPGGVQMVLAGSTIFVPFKEFSTKSLGFGFNGRVAIQIGDKLVQHQVGLNVTAIGSKPPEDDEEDDNDEE